MDSKGIKVTCRNCNRQALADEFVLDNYYKKMVCPQCVKDRKSKERITDELKKEKEAQAKEEEAKKPAGWDSEDEFLDRLHKTKVAQTVDVKPLAEGIVQYACPKCKFKFKYSVEQKTPSKCPYCATPVFNVRINR
jgi:predicted Zn-ribbon and HTH transcriptional regulator